MYVPGAFRKLITNKEKLLQRSHATFVGSLYTLRSKQRRWCLERNLLLSFRQLLLGLVDLDVGVLNFFLQVDDKLINV